MRNRSLTLLAICALICSCTWLARNEDERRVETAQADDRECRADGHRWPGEGYVECRRLLADARQREMWKELHMSSANDSGFGLSPAEQYRPIRAADFHCTLETNAAGESYVTCRERD